MRVVFMGTPELSATMLAELSRHHEVVGVFTRPDAVRGRGKKLIASPVKQRAEALGIAVHTPLTLRDESVVQTVEQLSPDIICVVAYGCILPRSILDIPRFGCLNVHTSLLPRWRGAAPIERAILAGDEQTGVCIMRMEEGLDTGPYCLCKTVPVQGYLEDLTARLADVGAEALVKALDQVQAGTAQWIEQVEDGLTYAEKIRKGELDFDLQDSAHQLCAKVRASSESHPSRMLVAGRRVAVERANVIRPEDLSGADLPEAGYAALVAKRLVVGTVDGGLELERVKPDGKKSMEGRAFASGIQGIKNMRVQWGKA